MSNKYGFADHVSILKTEELSTEVTKVMIRTTEMSYFSPSGKARLKAVAKYSIYLIASTDHDTIGGQYDITSKTEANKTFRTMTADNMKAYCISAVRI